MIITSSQKLNLPQNSNVTISIRLKELMEDDAKLLFHSLLPHLSKEDPAPPRSGSSTGLTLTQKALAITNSSPLGLRVLGR